MPKVWKVKKEKKSFKQRVKNFAMHCVMEMVKDRSNWNLSRDPANWSSSNLSH